MTREKKEQLTNRLVLNFGILLAGALILLYLNSALSSNSMITTVTYWILLVVAILSILLGIFLLVWGIKKKNDAKNYSAVCLGTFVASFILYLPKLGWIHAFNRGKAVATVYILMALYFIVLSIITAIQLRKPLVKSADKKIVHKKKRK